MDCAILCKLASISAPGLSHLENGENGSHVELLGKVKYLACARSLSLSGFWDVGLLGPPLHHMTLAWLPSLFLQDQILPVRLALFTPIRFSGPLGPPLPTQVLIAGLASFGLDS